MNAEIFTFNWDALAGGRTLDEKRLAEIKEVFDYLRSGGKKVAVIGKDETEELIQEIVQHKLVKHLDLITSMDSEETRKLKTVYHEFGLNSSNLLYVSGQPSGIRAAKAIGSISAGLVGSYDRRTLENAKPDYVLDKLVDVRKLCNGC